MTGITYLIKIAINIFIHRHSRKIINRYPRLAVFAFDDVSNNISIFGRYEDRILNALEHKLFNKLKGTDALDIGANIGNHSIAFSEYFETVYAFEANPTTFSLLKLNSEPYKNILPFCIGVSSEKGRFSFVENKNNLGGSKFIKRSDMRLFAPEDLIEVDTIRLDQFDPIPDAARIGFVKIDIEGHELDALKGMQEILVRNKPIIAFEILAAEINDGQCNVSKYLNGLGYHFMYEVNDSPSRVTYPSWIPNVIIKIMKVIEVVAIGPSETGNVRSIERLEKKNYPVVLISNQPLDFHAT